MLPVADEKVLRENPKFAELYKLLTTVVLNPDGTTKNDPQPKERAAVEERLRERRLIETKQRILRETISNLTPPAPTQRKPASSKSPPEQEFHDLLQMLPPLLDPDLDLPPEVLHTILTNPPFSNYDAHLATLAPLVSSSLQSQAGSLVRVLSPSTNSSFVHRSIPTLVPQVTELLETLASQTVEIATERIAVATTAVDLLSRYAQAITHLIRALEDKHGIAARSLEMRATEMALRARAVACDAKNALNRARKEVYGRPGVGEALTRYNEHLDLEEERLNEVIRRAEDKLEGYGVGVEGGEAREKVARELGKVWGEMGKEMESVQKDLDRLEKKK